MATTKHERTERERTDRSLRGERRRTDDELAKRTRDLEEDADAVVTTARRRADDVLARARANADEKLRHESVTRQEQTIVETERLREDDALSHERIVADEKRAAEREARRGALVALLTEERDQTDHHLGAERHDADAAIASRDDFLAIVSHDLRNMLNGISLSAGLLMNIRCDDQVQAPLVRAVERIQRYTIKMTRLVADLVDLASIEAGHLAVVPDQHETIELLLDTQEVFEPIAEARGISIRTEVRPGSLLASYDEERILQVLANLVGNAIKFTSRGGAIVILAERVEQHVRFSVTDTGRGIAADQLGVIFERYWQTARRERTGLGLGLYISRCIVDAHGGKIWAESQPGKGSTFYFTLPAAESPGAKDRPKH